jgi:hypothetical protein
MFLLIIPTSITLLNGSNRTIRPNSGMFFIPEECNVGNNNFHERSAPLERDVISVRLFYQH